MSAHIEYFDMNGDPFRSNNPVNDLLRLARNFNASMSSLDNLICGYEREVNSLRMEVKAMSDRVMRAEQNAGIALAEHHREIARRDRVAKRSICEFNMRFEERCGSCARSGDDYCDEVEHQYKSMLEGEGR